MALAPLLLVLASLQHQASGARVSIGYGIAFQVINEIGFAMLYPVGLALYSRAAPRQVGGMMMGVFYTVFFFCNLSVGRVGGWLESMGGARFWLLHAGVVAAAGVILAVVAWRGRRWLAPVDGSSPAAVASTATKPRR